MNHNNALNNNGKSLNHIYLTYVLTAALLLPSCSGRKAVRSLPSLEMPESYTFQKGENTVKGVIDKKYLSENVAQKKSAGPDEVSLLKAGFGDPQLAGLIEKALSGNLDLKRAMGRIQGAEANLMASEAAEKPMVNLNTETRRTRTESTLTGPMASDKYSGRHSLGIAASYETDLYGRLAKNRQSSALDRNAAMLDMRSIRISLAASVAELYYSIKEKIIAKEILARRIALSSEMLSLIRDRIAAGLASSNDLNRMERNVIALETESGRNHNQAENMIFSLNVLLGKFPGELSIEDFSVENISDYLEDYLPLPPAVRIGSPKHLSSRPDIAAAYLRLQASDKRLAAAAVAHLPSLSAAFSAAFGASEPSELLKNWTASIAGSLAGSVFDGGRRESARRSAEASRQDFLYQYGKSVLTALSEVEEAVNNEKNALRNMDLAERNLETTGSDIWMAQTRFEKGAAPLSAVLEADNQALAAKAALASARKSVISSRIVLARVLGGEL